MTTPILDVACGGKMFYWDKDDPRVTFCDIRDMETTLCDGRKFEIHPDYQCDFTDLPFENDSYSMVVFDPPHLTRCTGRSKYKELYGSLSEIATPSGWQQIKYGALYKDWREMLSKGFSECFRVLKPGGFLIFKWSEVDISMTEILKCTDVKPIFGTRNGRKAKTIWLCFMKERK